jgi:hypothetical protein
MDDGDGYTGPATLSVDGRSMPVHVVLDARHEPQDGHLHWFGRMRVDPAATDGGAVGRAADGGAANDGAAEGGALSGVNVELYAGAGPVSARLGDVDPWGRIRLTGVGAPPYPLPHPTVSRPPDPAESAPLPR